MKNNKGITLIALVITIIVLLILAGVSIAMLTGNNGILTQANTAKTDTAKAEAVERINMELNALYSSVLASTTKTTFTATEVSSAKTNVGTGYTLTPPSGETATLEIKWDKDQTVKGSVTITGAGAATLTPAE